MVYAVIIFCEQEVTTTINSRGNVQVLWLQNTARLTVRLWQYSKLQSFFVSLNKSVFSFLRTLKTWHCPHLLLRAVLRPRAAAAPAVQQSIDISQPPGPQQQTRRTLMQRANGTDRRTDGRTPYRYTDPALHTVRAGPIRAVRVIVRGVREQIFHTNSLPFQWLHFHSHPIPIFIWNLNPIPIFSHPVIPESLPFPPGNSNETSCYAQKVG